MKQYRHLGLMMALGLAGWLVQAAVGTPQLAGAGLDRAQLPGIVVDDDAATFQGNWQASSSVTPFVGTQYRYASGTSEQSVRFQLDIPSAGPYQVLVSYTPHPNRAAKVPVTVETAGGAKLVQINQQTKPKGPYCFEPIGQFDFQAGKTSITISTRHAQGVVVADAVQLLTPQAFQEAQRQAAKQPAPLLASDKSSKKAAPQADAPPKFVKLPAPQDKQRLTAERLDALLQEQLGGITGRTIADEAFLRRASLDIIGRPPTPVELSSLQSDTAVNKRAAAVERLLASPGYGANWANYWTDVIRFRVPEPELTFLDYTPLRQWLAEALNRDTSWDQITFQLLTAGGKVADNPAATLVGFHQADTSRLASETTRLFLGVNIQCAECHDHKFIDMPQETFHHFAAFFIRTEAKLPWNDSSQIEVKSKPKGEHKMPGLQGQMRPMAFGQHQLELGLHDLQRRAELAQWVVAPSNPWFAKAYTNRIWARLMGRGFCEPVDEIGELADPVLPQIHQAVADHFVATGYDTKELIRLITATRAYQRAFSADDADPDKPFAAVIASKLRGDEVFDSLVTALALPNIRPPATKATNAIRFPPPPKSTRDLVNEAYGFDPSLEASNILRTMRQSMFMMNNEQIQRQIDGSAESGTVLARLLEEEPDNTKAFERLFQAVLARSPNERERTIAREHIAQVKDRRAAFEDLLWGLINSAEFTTRN